MRKKEHFVIIPESLINKGDPDLILLYCKIYLLEVTRYNYSLSSFCKNNNFVYSRAYRMKKLAQKTLEKTEKKQKNLKKLSSDKPVKIEAQIKKQKKVEENGKSFVESQKTSPRIAQQTGIVGPYKEKEKEKEITNELLTDHELNKLSPAERELYYAQNYQQLIKEGRI